MSDNKEAVVQHLLLNGWQLGGETRVERFRTHSFAFGGGPIVTTGGRTRMVCGDCRLTVGSRTICLYKKPTNPETVLGRGRLTGQTVYTFRDWPMVNISVKGKQAGGLIATLETLDEAIKEFCK